MQESSGEPHSLPLVLETHSAKLRRDEAKRRRRFFHSSVRPPRESTPRSQPPCVRAVPAQDRRTLSECRSRPPASTIRPSQRRRADRACVLRGGRSCSRARDRPPRSLNDWATHSTRRTARNERYPRHAAGDSAATEDLRAWTSRPLPAHQIEKPTWPHAPAVPLSAASGDYRNGRQRRHNCPLERNRHRCGLRRSANGAGNRRESRANRAAGRAAQSIAAEMRTRGRYRPASVVPRRVWQPATQRFRGVSSACASSAVA